MTFEIKTNICEDDEEEGGCSFVNGELVTFYRRWSFGDSLAGVLAMVVSLPEA